MNEPDFDHNSYETPEYLYEYFNEQYKFELDVAANEHNSKCGKYFRDAFSKDSWGDHAQSFWCNPPFSNQRKWLKLCYEQAKKCNITVVCLVIAWNGGLYHHDYVVGHATRLIQLCGRVAFLHPVTKIPQKGYRWGTVAIVYEKNHIDTGNTKLESVLLTSLCRQFHESQVEKRA